MADEAMVRFGYIREDEINKALEQQLVTAWSVVFTSDSKRIYLIDDKLEKVPLKSRVPIYSSVDTAIADINRDSSAYAGELVSIYNSSDECFDAYVINQWPDGSLYVKPVSDATDLDYNRMLNIPIVNLPSTVLEPVDLKTLEPGYYKINYFISPVSGSQINSIVGDLFFVEYKGTDKLVKRIGSQNIFDYKIDADGNCTSTKYVTEKYLKDNKYQTESDVDTKLEAFKVVVQKLVEDYVKNTVELLVRHVVSEEITSRGASQEDIIALFKED